MAHCRHGISLRTQSNPFPCPPSHRRNRLMGPVERVPSNVGRSCGPIALGSYNFCDWLSFLLGNMRSLERFPKPPVGGGRKWGVWKEMVETGVVEQYRAVYFQCWCYLALPLCTVSMHLTRCALWHVMCLFFLCFFNFLFLKLQFMRIKMYI